MIGSAFFGSSSEPTQAAVCGMSVKDEQTKWTDAPIARIERVGGNDGWTNINVPVHFGGRMNVAQGEQQVMLQERSGFLRAPKRRRMMARRRLEANFDAVSEDRNAQKQSVHIPAAYDDDLDTLLGSAASSQTEDGWPNRHEQRQNMSINLQNVYQNDMNQNFSSDSGGTCGEDSVVGCHYTLGEESSMADSFVSVPLLDLLTSERGKCLTVEEMKAMVYSLVEDLLEIHESGCVHGQVTIESAVLQIHNGSARVCLRKNLHGEDCVLDTNGSPTIQKFGLQRIDSYAAPETVYCPEYVHASRTSNMWSIGCIVFALLSGGQLPFGEHGIGVAGGETMFLSVDKQQQWLELFMNQRMHDVNKSANLVGPEQNFGMGPKVLGFDSKSVDLIQCLLRVDPAQRFTAEIMLNHPWFAGVRETVPRFNAEEACLGEESVPSLDHRDKEDAVHHHRANKYPKSESDGMSELWERQESLNCSQTCLPYRMIGRVEQPIQVMMGGKMVQTKALHAVYLVPNQGAMMAAKPFKIFEPIDGDYI